MEVIFFDINKDVCDVFEKFGFSVINSDIRDLPKADAVVSPANSFGFMDGGIDWHISDYLGWHIQDELKSKIRLLTMRELLIGQSISIETGHDIIGHVISAPTMRVPLKVFDPYDITLACRSAILTAIEEGMKLIYFTGMGTGCGQLPFVVAAKAMRLGIDQGIKGFEEYPDWKTGQFMHVNLL